tara:strand:- start:6304 stop:6852 length:549 start_codon:yes stop_codon:yes gene_type:complete
MQNFTEKRVKNTSDEVWLLEHESIYTYGVKTNINDIPNNISLPILKSDRGGEITFHGPGQLIVYPLIDLKRRHMRPREFISNFQEAILHSLSNYQTNLLINNDEPGIYFDNKKIVSFGLKITQKGTYHGASINISMDLAPWKEIAICGNSQIEAIDLETLGCKIPLSEIRDSINKKLAEKFE